MKMKVTIIAIVCLLALGLAAANARADTLSLTTDGYLGKIVPGIPPSADLTYLEYLVNMSAGTTELAVNLPTSPSMYQDFYRSSFMLPGGAPAPTGSAATPDLAAPVDLGYSYLMAKYDQDKAGTYVWYLPALDPSKTYYVPQLDPNLDKYGLSGVQLFDPRTVPDGGVTLMLLGGALVGLATLRRKFRA